MEAPQVKKIDLLEDAAAAFPMLMEVAQKKHAADEAVIEATVQATQETQSTTRMKRRMMAAVSSKQDVAAAPPRLGAPQPQFPFPPLPPLPPSAGGAPDGTVTGWNGTSYDAYNMSHTGYMNKLMDLFLYYDAHPTTTTFYTITEYINNLAQLGLLNSNVDNMMNLCNGTALLSDGIERTAELAFLMGYTDSSGKVHAAGMDSYDAYLSDMQTYLTSVSGSFPNKYTTAMLNETNTLIADETNFKQEHVAANGDLIWTYRIPGSSYANTYDWTTADDDTKFMITQLILNSGTTGDPNGDISNLTAALGQMQTFDLLNTMDTVWNKYHDAGLLIIVFMLTMDDSYLNQESGNADIMDKQHQYDQKYVQQIQSIVSTIGTWSGTTGTTGAATLQEIIPMVIDLANASGQFQALQGPILNFMQNLQSTNVTGTLDGTSYSNITLEDVLITHSYTDASGKVHEISASEAATILYNNLTPQPSNPYVPPTPPTPTPPVNPTPSTETLQGFISSVTAISSAISSSSTQLTTSTSQVEQMHQAILKLGTGVVDPKNGLMAVTNNAVSRQVSS